MTARIGVLASGGGSNLQALLEHLDARGARRGGDVVLVASDRATSGALERARARGIATATLPAPSATCHGLPSLDRVLSAHGVDLVVLAGYLKLVPAEVVRRFPGRMLNVHPSLLPAFGGPGMYGVRVHQAVIDSGARVSGATVHLVDEEYDRGRIVAQWPVPVLVGDDAHTLAARVLHVEHLLFPRVIDAVADGRRLPAPGAAADAFSLATDFDAARIADDIERFLAL